MADARTRQLERRAAQGDGWARRGLLAERLRRGELSAPRVRLGAWLDDDAAGELAGAPPADWTSWARGLAGFEREACLRASVAAAHLALSSWEAWEAAEFAPSPQIGESLRLAERAWETGDDDAHGQAMEALLAAEQSVDGASHLLAFLEAEHGLELSRGWRAHRAGLAALACVRGILAHLASPRPSAEEDVSAAALEVAEALGDPSAVRAAISAALLPWALPWTLGATPPPARS